MPVRKRIKIKVWSGALFRGLTTRTPRSRISLRRTKSEVLLPCALHDCPEVLMSSVAVIPVTNTVSAAASSPAILRVQIESTLGEGLASTLLLREREIPISISTGVPALDALTGGFPRGALSEISGSISSGRTGVMLAALANATQREEVCALVDASDSFDPASAVAAGVDLNRLLWVRCCEQRTAFKRTELPILKNLGQPARISFAFSHALEQVLKVTDLLLQGGGFGMVALDLGDIPAESVRRIPLTSWFRFRRVVEPTATVLLLVEQEPCAKTCASLVLRLQTVSIHASPKSSCQVVGTENAQATDPSNLLRMQFSETVKNKSDAETQRPHIPENNIVGHADLFQGMRLRAEVLRSWRQRKPPQSVDAQFELRAAL